MSSHACMQIRSKEIDELVVVVVVVVVVAAAVVVVTVVVVVAAAAAAVVVVRGTALCYKISNDDDRQSFRPPIHQYRVM